MFEHVELEFEELKSKTTNGARVYETPDGTFPSITTVLGRKKAQFFKEWRVRVGEEEANKITPQATRRGTKVHKVVENYIDNKENYFEDSQPNVRAMFNSIKPFLDNNLSNIAGIEIPLWSKQLGVAGRCDCVADWKGQKAIIDWKTSGKPKKKEWVEEYFLQATAYSIMFEERTAIPINDIVIVIGVENEEPQIFEEKSFNYWKTLETTLQEWL